MKSAPFKISIMMLCLVLTGHASFASPTVIADASSEVVTDPLKTSVSQSVQATAPMPAASGSQIESLTKQILLEEIALERFNIHYRQHVAYQGRFKAARYFLSQETNNALTGAGLIVGVAERAPKFHHPERLNNQHLERANEVQFVGQTIAVLGSSTEFWINEYHEWQAHKQGFGPKTARAFVLEKRRNIERLLTQRSVLVEAEKVSAGQSSHYKLDVVEGQILSSMKDISLDEFVKVHSSQRGYLAFQQILYTLDVLRNSAGSVGSALAYESNHLHNRKFNYSSGVVGIISGAIAMSLPVASRIGGKLVEIKQKHYVKEVSANIKPDEMQLTASIDKMHDLCDSAGKEPEERAISRYALYKNENTDLAMQMERSQKSERKSRMAATENIATGAYTGSTKVANSIMYTISGRNYPTNARVSNCLIGSGNIAYLTGNAVAVFDNLRIQISHEIDHEKRKRHHQLTSQILQERLKTLDTMESNLNKLSL